jgi:CRP/FNR family transcriptional regulator
LLSPVEKVRLLSLVDVLQPLSREQIEKLSWQVSDLQLQKGAIFYAPGDPSEKAFILRKGRVQIYRLVAGRELTLAMVGPGTVFGDIALTAPRLHGAYAQAMEPTEVSVVSNAVLRRLILKHPEVGLQIADLLSERLSMQESRMAEIAFKEVPARLASFILRLVEGESVVTREGYRIPTRYTHQQLGTFIGTSREAVTNAFTLLREAGAVKVICRHIYVKDIQALRRIAG